MFFYEIIQKKEIQLETNKDMLINFSEKQNNSFRKHLYSGGRKILHFNEHRMHATSSCLAFRNVRDVLFNIVARHYFIEFLKINPSAVDLVQKWIEIQNGKVFLNSRSLHNILHIPSTPELVGELQEIGRKSNNHSLPIEKSKQNVAICNPQMKAEETRCNEIIGDFKNCTSKQNSKQRFTTSYSRLSAVYSEGISNKSEFPENNLCKSRVGMKLNDHKQRPRSEIFTNQTFLNEMTQPPTSSQKKLYQSTKPLTEKSLEPIIETVLQHRYFEEFLRSDQFWRYVMEVVSSSRLQLSDVLYSEIVLGYFVEFVEEENKSELLQCWLEMEIFRQVHCISGESATRTRLHENLIMEDASTIFNKYEFFKNIKTFVKQNLSSSEFKLKRQAFLLPQVIAYRTLDEHFLKFLVSAHFYNFVTNLVMSGKSQPKSRVNGEQILSEK